MPGDAIRRVGELSEQSLRDAVAAEWAEGRRPYALSVGSVELKQAALQILAPQDAGMAGLDLLRAVVPRVEVRAGLLPGEWELQQCEELYE